MLVDFISLMRASARASGKLRPDLLAALKGLAPPFIRWPGGSYASIYKWKDGIGPAVSRKYNPNTIWGGYSDYYGFGTDEFLELCRQLGAAPMIVLAATGTDPAQLEYALEWVHYLVDPPTTEWGRRRAANGHPEPYRVPYIQIDNEPMNHELSPDAVRRDRQPVRPAAARDRAAVQDRRVRTEALERHELEREADRSRGPELRHPRQPQLRVRAGELRDRRAADRGLSREAGRIRAPLRPSEHRDRGARVGLVPAPTIGVRACTRPAACSPTRS